MFGTIGEGVVTDDGSRIIDPAGNGIGCSWKIEEEEVAPCIEKPMVVEVVIRILSYDCACVINPKSKGFDRIRKRNVDGSEVPAGIAEEAVVGLGIEIISYDQTRIGDACCLRTEPEKERGIDGGDVHPRLHKPTVDREICVMAYNGSAIIDPIGLGVVVRANLPRYLEYREASSHVDEPVMRQRIIREIPDDRSGVIDSIGDRREGARDREIDGGECSSTIAEISVVVEKIGVWSVPSHDIAVVVDPIS